MNESLTLAELARLYRPRTLADARRVLRAKGGDIRRAAELLTIARRPR